MPVAVERPKRHAVRCQPVPIRWSRRGHRRHPRPFAQALGRSANPPAAASIVDLRGSGLRLPARAEHMARLARGYLAHICRSAWIGHRAGGSPLAVALCTAACIFGVKRSVSTPAISMRAASASPTPSNSHARSWPSTGWTSRGAVTLASKACRRAICAQREAIGVSIRRISVDGKPHWRHRKGRVRARSSGLSWPTSRMSRRAQPGYSTGGGGGSRFRPATISTALSSGDTD